MAESTPIVSVVIPAIGAPALLVNALSSVFAQTFEDFEVLVVTDPDATETMAQLVPLQQRYGSKLRVINHSNGGIGSARNRGLDDSLGTYIAMLDHEDRWKPNKLAEQVRFMQGHPQCVACGTLFALSESSDEPQFILSQVCDESGIVHRPFFETVQGRGVFNTSTLMIDRARTAGIRFGTERGSIDDVQLYIRLLTRGLYGIAGNQILAVHRRGETNSSRQADIFYKGATRLRRLQRANTFKGLPPQQRQDMQLWIAQLARSAAMKQLLHRRRRRAVKLYFRELWPQAKQGHWRFVAAYPFQLLARSLKRKKRKRRQ